MKKFLLIILFCLFCNLAYGQLCPGSNLIFLTECNGTDGSTTFTDEDCEEDGAISISNSGVVVDTDLDDPFGNNDGQAYFSGSNARLYASDNSKWDFLTGVTRTIEFWINVPSVTTAYYIYGQVQSYDPDIYSYIYTDDAGNVWWQGRSGAIGTLTRRSTAHGMSVNTWNHMAFTFDGTTAKIFVNGTEEDSGSHNTIASVSAPLQIGERDVSNDQDLSGYLDEIAVWDTLHYTTSFTPNTVQYTVAAPDSRNRSINIVKNINFIGNRRKGYLRCEDIMPEKYCHQRWSQNFGWNGIEEML